MRKPRHSESYHFRCSIIPATRAATDASAAPSRERPHGSRWKWWLAFPSRRTFTDSPAPVSSALLRLIVAPHRPVPLLAARFAHAASGRGRLLPAFRAQIPGETLGDAPVEPVAVGGPPLPGARLALAAMGRGRALPALEAQATGAALGGSPVVALQIAHALGLDVLPGHRDVLPAVIGVQRADARPARRRRDVLGSAAYPFCRRSWNIEVAISPHT